MGRLCTATRSHSGISSCCGVPRYTVGRAARVVGMWSFVLTWVYYRRMGPYGNRYFVAVLFDFATPYAPHMWGGNNA